jgi:hypothetical protein
MSHKDIKFFTSFMSLEEISSTLMLILALASLLVMFIAPVAAYFISRKAMRTQQDETIKPEDLPPYPMHITIQRTKSDVSLAPSYHSTLAPEYVV